MRLGTILTIGLVLFSSVSCMKKRVTGLRVDPNANLADPNVGDPNVCPNGISATIIPQNGTSFTVGASVTFTIVASGCNFGYGVYNNGILERFSSGNSTQVTITQPTLAQSGRMQRFEISAYATSARTQVGRGPFAFYSTPFDLVGSGSGDQETVVFEPQGRVQVVGNQIEFSITSSSKIQVNSIESSEAGYIQGSVYSLSGEPPVATAVSYPFDVDANAFKKYRVILSRGVPGNSSSISVKYKKYTGTTLGTTVLTSTVNTSHNSFPANYPNDYLGQGYNQNLLYDPANGNIFWSFDTSGTFLSSFRAPSGEAVRELLTGQLDNQNGADLLFVTTSGSGASLQAKFYMMKSSVVNNGSSTGVNFGSAASCGAWSGAPVPNSFTLGPVTDSRSIPTVYYYNANNQIFEARLTVNGSSCSISPAVEAGKIAVSANPDVPLTGTEQLCSGRRMKIIWSGRGLGSYDTCRLFARVDGVADEAIGATSVAISGGSISSRTEYHTIRSNTEYVVKCVRGQTSIEEVARQALGTCAATGGTESIITVGSDRYKVHTFSSSGSLNVTDNSGPFEILVVAGGGGGGEGSSAGGGGAGGLLHRSDYRFDSTGAKAVAVGAGGAKGANGSNSSIGTLVANGGGRGGSDSNRAGGDGGSGGGGAWKGSTGKGKGTSGQGNDGANSRFGNWRGGGGGGGAGAVGGNAGYCNSRNNSASGGAGGAGVSKEISGTAVFYAGGGGGKGQHCGSAGGNGGGGAAGAAGQNGLGGGGGANAAGGSGVVIVRYRIAPAQ